MRCRRNWLRFLFSEKLGECKEGFFLRFKADRLLLLLNLCLGLGGWLGLDRLRRHLRLRSWLDLLGLGCGRPFRLGNLGWLCLRKILQPSALDFCE